MTKYSDILFLPRELQHTPLGRRYEGACLMMRITVLELKVMFGYLRNRRTARDLIEPRIHHCRRKYITYSNLASVALDELTRTFGWPAESAADESFTWPPAPVPHKVDPTPAAPIPASTFEMQLSELIRQGYRLTKVYLPPESSPDR